MIFRAEITLTCRGVERSQSYIVKIEPFLEGAKKDMTADRTFFKVEGHMYTDILPAMQDLLKNIGDDEIIAPNLIHFNEERKILIFQDIAPQNFVMNRDPVPFPKASLIAKKLGKFHALSYFLKEEQGDQRIETYQEGMFQESNTADWDYMDVYLEVLSKMLPEWDESLKPVADKLTAMKPDFIKRMLNVYKKQPRGQGINVLNHGDFHIRNLLFRFDDQQNFETIRFVSGIGKFTEISEDNKFSPPLSFPIC